MLEFQLQPAVAVEARATAPSLFSLRGPRLSVGPDPSSKATLWVKAQHEGALPPPCIVRKDTRWSPTFHNP